MKLTDAANSLKGIGPKKLQAMQRLGINTVYDLLTYYPRTYQDLSHLTPLGELQAETETVVTGLIVNVQEHRSHRGMNILSVFLSDGTGYLEVVWFNQPFLKRQLLLGRRMLLAGKVQESFNRSGLAMSQLSYFEILSSGDDVSSHCGMLPIYNSTESLSQKLWQKVMRQLLDSVEEIGEVLPDDILGRYRLMGRKEAFQTIHFPGNIQQLTKARQRLAFEELYLIQCGLLLMKREQAKVKGVRHLLSSSLVCKVYKGLPFKLTGDQEKTWRAVEHDMEKEERMSRLIQGDVGSGKTVLALLALVKTVENGYQGAMMVPTEILARQHVASFQKLLAGTNIKVGLLSGKMKKKEHEEMLEKIAAHEVDIIIGTHALIQQKVQYDKLGLVVTDEQHRFGINQRADLRHKSGLLPDVLVMTATPIPRTMTLTVYGDLDVSLIRELPPGRQPIRTFVRNNNAREKIYQFVHREVQAGRQAYVVCPLIAENEDVGVKLKAAEEIFQELSRGLLQEVSCGLLHGRMKQMEKEATMQRFHAGEIQVLVATTVIEVGVDVSNATVMVIENAERFGLAQLHQLRGRIGRGKYSSYCILVSGGKSSVAQERLKILENTRDGFLLAEEDLKLRGPGQFFGIMQHGAGDLKIANVLTDVEILLQARRAALETMESQPDLSFVAGILQMQYKDRFGKITEA